VEEISKFFDFLYSHFVFRDIAAKVLPGLLALVSLGQALCPVAPDNLKSALEIPIVLQVVGLYGIGFAAGILLQFLGMKIGLTRTHVWQDADGKYSTSISVEKAVEFIVASEKSTPLSRKRERMIVLKEMMGNYGIALIIFSISRLLLIICDRHSVTDLVAAISCGIIAIPLIWHNRVLASEQKMWEDHGLNQLNNKKSA